MKDLLIPEGGWLHTTSKFNISNSNDTSFIFRLVGKSAKFLGRDEVPDIFKLLSKHPQLFWSWLHFASKLFPLGQLKGREREIIILRVAWLCRCKYEWAQHIEIGLRNGLQPKDIKNISIGADAIENEKEKTLLLACDELIHNTYISENTWQLLKSHYSEKLLIEISLLIGHYQMLAGLLNSSGLTLEPYMEDFLEKFHLQL